MITIWQCLARHLPNTVNSLYLEHLISRTSLYLEQFSRSLSINSSLIFSLYLEFSLSRTNSLVPCEFEIERVHCNIFQFCRRALVLRLPNNSNPLRWKITVSGNCGMFSQFWDAMCLYGWRIPNLPANCTCVVKFDIQHYMTFKKGEFVNITRMRSNEIPVNRSFQRCCRGTFVNAPTCEHAISKTAKIGDTSDISASIEIRKETFG